MRIAVLNSIGERPNFNSFLDNSAAPLNIEIFIAKPALGRGLGALLGGTTAAKQQTSPAVDKSKYFVQSASIKKIHPCPFQPRKDFTEESLEELASSIRQNGILQPLVVRWRGEEFELIAGERRWRAAQKAG